MVVLVFLTGESFYVVTVAAVNFNEMFISQCESVYIC